MEWKLKSLLWIIKYLKPVAEVEISQIQEQRAKNIEVSRLGQFLFDKKENVSLIENQIFSGIPVRIYRNSNAKGQRVIIYFHGGGFCFYNIDSHDYVTRRLCKMNQCTVISVDYRLAPEHTFPSAQEDAFKIVEFVYHHADELKVDAHQIIVAGDSAGGTLSACAAHHFKNHDNIKLAAQILIYPWVDGRVNSKSIQQLKEGYMLTKSSILWFQKTYVPRIEDRLNPLAAPLHHTDFSDLAPAFVATAEFDPLRDEGKEYADHLIQAGVNTKYVNYEGLIHGFANIPLVASNGLDLFRDIKSFLDKV
ncbi:MAG: alpha/beta hydrolase [Chitinophagales bacterium]|nr:alpha/beta hydrolase [Chitinophagales bacterium]